MNKENLDDKWDWRFHWRDDWREIAPVTILVVVLVAIMVLVYGCSPTVPSPCTPDQLAAIEAAYVAEAVQRCDGQTWESCDALPEVRAKYDRIREEWVTCGN